MCLEWNLAMDVFTRNPDLDFVDPHKELNIGIWTLYTAATLFLAARLWTKIIRHRGLWYDDYILLIAWVGQQSYQTPLF